MAKKQLSLSDVKQQFGAWQVPSQAHFEALINIAALSLKPGNGLTGGDPSPEADKIDTGQVTPLRVQAYHGITAMPQQGVAVKPDPVGGLTTDNDKSLTVKASDSVGFDDKGVFLKVNESKALKVKGGGIAVEINTAAGLNAAKGVSVSVDNKTVEMDKNGALRVRCDHTGGLTVDQEGYLGVDLDIILRRPCLRAYQGWAYAYIPKSMIETGDKVFLYIHDLYVGEFYHTGVVPSDSRIKIIAGSEATEYWIVELNQWVTEKDVLRARLIKNGQDENTGTDIASHTVTSAGAAPAVIPRITGVEIVNALGLQLEQVKAGDIIHAKSDTDANILTHRWKIMNDTAKAWNNIEKNDQAEFTVPADAPVGAQFCVLLERKGKDSNLPYAFSRPVTVSKT
ncbi:hypothetical protein [Serratia marcescens]|uniref:hypothetical protein n=1 Tax=Serratia marcescens TaxID=615 RepID=UPI00146AA892|nr:hypothetical protein [Serratia marcescens]NMT27077.1 hypothetical protein [Serratia marcescens]